MCITRLGPAKWYFTSTAYNNKGAHFTRQTNLAAESGYREFEKLVNLIAKDGLGTYHTRKIIER